MTVNFLEKKVPFRVVDCYIQLYVLVLISSRAIILLLKSISKLREKMQCEHDKTFVIFKGTKINTCFLQLKSQTRAHYKNHNLLHAMNKIKK